MRAFNKTRLFLFILNKLKNLITNTAKALVTAYDFEVFLLIFILLYIPIIIKH